MARSYTRGLEDDYVIDFKVGRSFGEPLGIEICGIEEIAAGLAIRIINPSRSLLA
jgi:hypothetical protein